MMQVVSTHVIAAGVGILLNLVLVVVVLLGIPDREKGSLTEGDPLQKRDVNQKNNDGSALDAGSTPPLSFFQLSLGYFWELLSMAKTATPPLRLLLCLRFTTSLAFHVFNVAFIPSLKLRFGLRPKDFGAFMGVVGFCYMISQIFVAKYAIKYAKVRRLQTQALPVTHNK